MEYKYKIELYVNGELEKESKLNIDYIIQLVNYLKEIETKQKKDEAQTQNYEGVCIFDPKTSIKELENSINKITSNMNKCNKIERIGIKKLAYIIKKCNEGYYVTFDYIANDFNIQEIERHERIDSNIIKFINIKKDNEKEVL